ncbi:MAG: agmatinase [Syntrophomonadaceae bacterium]|jgi:agmatinase|nr:agmatinase [Syntrophomonadaceae bacterium]
MKQAIEYLESKAVFMAASNKLENCEKVLLGIPFDATTSFRPGTRLAPYRIREVSEGIEEYSIYQDRSLETLDFYDAGDIILPFGNVIECMNRIEHIGHYFLKQGKKLFSMGGEHLISWPLIKSYHQHYPELVVLQLDAHADLRDHYLGETLSHASVMRQAAELLGPRRVFQLGIRSCTGDELSYAQSHTRIYVDVLLEVLDQVKELIGSRPVYFTLDIDVLDPAFAPGTGTPEPGGFSSRQVLQLMHQIQDLNIVGFDLVEVSPPYDNSEITSILAAKILREALLAY